MRGYIVYEDQRFKFLEGLLEQAGDCMVHSFRHLKSFDYIVFGMKGPDCHLRYQEENQTRRLANDFFSKLKKGCRIYTFIFNPFIQEMCDLYELSYQVFSKDEKVIQGNADLTSEAVLEWLIRNRKQKLKGSTITIFGYGHLAKSLVSYLLAMDTKIHIVCRNRMYDKEIQQFGIPHDFNSQGYQESDIFINTVPAQILSSDHLSQLKQSAVLLDISSFPFGFDLDVALLIGLKAEILSGLPGKFAYQDAAKLLFENIMEGRSHV